MSFLIKSVNQILAANRYLLIFHGWNTLIAWLAVTRSFQHGSELAISSMMNKAGERREARLNAAKLHWPERPCLMNLEGTTRYVYLVLFIQLQSSWSVLSLTFSSFLNPWHPEFCPNWAQDCLFFIKPKRPAPGFTLVSWSAAFGLNQPPLYLWPWPSLTQQCCFPVSFSLRRGCKWFSHNVPLDGSLAFQTLHVCKLARCVWGITSVPGRLLYFLKHSSSLEEDTGMSLSQLLL